MRGSSLSLLCLVTLLVVAVGPANGHGGRVSQRHTSRSIIHKVSVGKHQLHKESPLDGLDSPEGGELVILVTESSPTSGCLTEFIDSARQHFPDVPVIASTYNSRHHASTGEAVLLLSISIQTTIGQARKKLVSLAAQKGYTYAIMASDVYTLLPSTDFSVLLDSLERGADISSPSVCSGAQNDCNTPPCMLFMGDLGEKERKELGEWILEEEKQEERRGKNWENQMDPTREIDAQGNVLNEFGDDEDEDIFEPIFDDEVAEEERMARLTRRKKRQQQRLQLEIQQERQRLLEAYQQKETREQIERTKSISRNKARIQISSLVDKYYRSTSYPRYIAQVIPYLVQNTSDFGEYCSETAVIQGLFAARVETLEKMDWDTKVVSDLSPHDYDTIFTAAGGKEAGGSEGMKFSQCVGTRVGLDVGCNQGHLETAYFPSVMYVMKKWGIGVLWDEKLEKVFMLPKVEEKLKEAGKGEGGEGQIVDDVFGLRIRVLRRDIHPKSEISPFLSSPLQTSLPFISTSNPTAGSPNPLYNHLYPLLTSVFGSYVGHTPASWKQFLFFSHKPIGSFVTYYSVKASLIQSPPPRPQVSSMASSPVSSPFSFQGEEGIKGLNKHKEVPLAPLHRKMKLSESPVTTVRLEVAVPNRTSVYHKSFLFPIALWTSGGVGVQFGGPQPSKTPAFHYFNSSSSPSPSSTSFPPLSPPSTPSFTRSPLTSIYHPLSPPPIYLIAFHHSDSYLSETDRTLSQAKGFGFFSINLAAPSELVSSLDEKYGSFVRIIGVKGSFSIQRAMKESLGDIEKEIGEESSSIDPILVIATANFVFPASLPDLIRQHVGRKTSVFAPECFSPLPPASSSSTSPLLEKQKHFGSLIALYLSDYIAIGGLPHRWGMRDSINYLLQTLSSAQYLILRPPLPTCQLTTLPLSINDPTRPAPHFSIPFPLSPSTTTESQTVFNSAVELIMEGERRDGRSHQQQQQQLPFQIQALLVGSRIDSAEIYPKSQFSSSFGFYKIIAKTSGGTGGDRSERSITLLVGSYLVPWVTRWRLLDAEAGSAFSMMELRGMGGVTGAGIVEEEVPLVREKAMREREEEARRKREERRENMRIEMEKDRERRRAAREAQRGYHEKLKKRILEDKRREFEDDKKNEGGSLRLVNHQPTLPPLPKKTMGPEERMARERLRSRMRH